VLLAATYWVFIGRNDPAEWGAAVYRLWAKGEWLAIANVSVFFGTLLFLAAWCFLRVVNPIFRYTKDSSLRARAEKGARDRYGAQWLGLSHPLDEPINALSGTLGAAPVITPRIRVDGLLNLIPFLGPIANHVLARAADEFAWTQIIRRAQGANLSGHELIRVGRAPEALYPGYAGIDKITAAKMVQAADAKAAGSAGRLRALLEAAYDTQKFRASS